MPTRIMIVAGEASGELYGALLAEALRQRWPGVRLTGVGGVRMEAAEVELIGHITGAFGLVEALSSVVYLRSVFKKLVNAMKTLRIDVLVLIDFPDFNLRAARAAKKYGIKVLYYVSPQVWAWRRGRIGLIARVTDGVAALLPFEPALYERAGARCEFVGHPAADELKARRRKPLMEAPNGAFPEALKELTAPVKPAGAAYGGKLEENLPLKQGSPVVAILPGSRHSELSRHLPVMTEAVRLIRKSYPAARFLLPFASHLHRDDYSKLLEEMEDLGVRVVMGRAIEVLSVSDVAVIASGTAAFQAALLSVPMVVIYKMSSFSYHIGRMLIKVKYINLVNLIFDTGVVRELIQEEVTAQRITDEVRRLLDDEEARGRMKAVFDRLWAIYENKNPTMRVVEMIAELCGE